MAAPKHDWYLAQWLKTLRFTQAALERATGWDKRKASFLVTGQQRFNRDSLNEAAAALNIEPFELLLHPEDAFALRRMRQDAIRIAAESRSPWHGFPVETSHDAAEETPLPTSPPRKAS